MIEAQHRTAPVWQSRVPFRVHVKGDGPPLVYFHGPWGLAWGPFLDALAQRFTVYAPEHPGTTPGEPDTISQIDSLWDLVLCYDELLDHLELPVAALVGHSFGGMMACEVAAARPSRARRLVLIDPIGLWRDDAPVVNWMLRPPQDLAGWVFHDPKAAPAREMFAMPSGPEEAAVARTQLIWSMGSTGKFIWPIPDKGLKKRLHRVTAPALLVWGREDRLVPVSYAETFAGRLVSAKTEVVDGAGHAPHLERPEPVARLVSAFLQQ
jgi:pimeloyl-ACP methyl ester carboxylesterase